MGAPVNLERPLLPTGRLSGHIVQGHVDGTGELVSYREIGDGNWWLEIRVPAELDRYLVYKGSIAVDGISLTIATLENCDSGDHHHPPYLRDDFAQTIPPGDRLNIECDILAKHVEKLMALRTTATV